MVASGGFFIGGCAGSFQIGCLFAALNITVIATIFIFEI